MSESYFRTAEFWVSAIYLLIVLICFLFAYHIKPGNNDWFFSLIYLTFPWSMITFFVMMFAIHSGFEYQAAIFLFGSTASLNAFLIYFIVRYFRCDKGSGSPG